MSKTKKLSMQVINNENLASGKTADITFEKNYGTIGSGANDTWIIDNQTQSVKKEHAKIELIDGHFCIKANADNLFLNGIDLFAAAKPVRLQHDDFIDIYNLQIKVILEEQAKQNIENDIIQSLMPKAEDIIASYQNTSNKNQTSFSVLSKEQDVLSSISGMSNTQVSDNNIEANELFEKTLNPLQLLDAERNSSKHFLEQNANYLPSNQHEKTAVMTFNSSNDNILNHSIVLDNPSVSSSLTANNDAFASLNKLFQGLNHAVAMQNKDEVEDFLTQIGASIKIMIEGLKELHASNQYLADRHLRPIEDNPLRLDLSYEETLDLLYTNNKHAVHLAATSAIKESLHNIKLHYEANQLAISEALAVLLASFAPEALMQRFVRYRRSNEDAKQDSSWIWDMYNYYYQELSSKRQKGFDKLFWEIYEAAYDRSIRKLQQNQDDN